MTREQRIKELEHEMGVCAQEYCDEYATVEERIYARDRFCELAQEYADVTGDPVIVTVVS